jgi:hypothetical protein
VGFFTIIFTFYRLRYLSDNNYKSTLPYLLTKISDAMDRHCLEHLFVASELDLYIHISFQEHP